MGTSPAGGGACAVCHQPITSSYFAAGDKVVCPACRDRIVAATTGGSGFVRFLRALAFGCGAGLCGALLWYGVQKLTGYQVGLIAIVVGLMVGGAVRAGARGRGGVGYQLLAVALTYLAIAVAFAPLLIEEALKGEPAGATTLPAGGDAPPPVWFLVAFACVLALVAPIAQAFTGGFIGALIVGFALWEAWRINRPTKLALSGPYAVGPAAAPSSGGVQAYGPNGPVPPQPPPVPPPYPTGGA